MYTCSRGERDHEIPGSYGHYEQDAQTYADWGVECECYFSSKSVQRNLRVKGPIILAVFARTF